MTLDNSLNALTTNFEDNDDRKFSMTTPNRGTSAYLRLWDGDLGGSCPSSKRIIEDVDKCFRSMTIYHNNKGCYSPELGDNPRHGHREKTNSGLKKRGGKRTRDTVQNHTTVFVHPSSQHGIAVKINNSQQNFLDDKSGEDSESEFTENGT
jgi:hypothetical protein